MLFTVFCVKGEAIPIQAWTGPEGPRRFRLPDLETISTWVRKVVSPTHHFYQMMSRPQGHIVGEGCQCKIPMNWTHHLLACSAVPQPTELLHSPCCVVLDWTNVWSCIVLVQRVEIQSILKNEQKYQNAWNLKPSSLKLGKVWENARMYTSAH
jgi:hypothetical protein